MKCLSINLIINQYTYSSVLLTPLQKRASTDTNIYQQTAQIS